MTSEEPFDASASARALQEKVRDIQQLLHTYESQTKQLRKEVQGFIERDDAEQEQMRAMTVDVIRTEMECLQNKAYVAFSRARQAETVQQQLMLSGDGPSLAAALGAWAPGAHVALSRYTAVRDARVDGRTGRLSKEDGAFDEQLAQLVNDLRGADDAPLALFCNGTLLTRHAGDTAHSVRSHVEHVYGNKLPGLTASQQYLCYTNSVYDVVAAEGSAAVAEAVRAAVQHVDELPVMHDGCDCLVAVPVTRLRDTLTFRAFFVRGELAAIEHLGAHVDVYSLMRGSVAEVDKRLADTFTALYTMLAPCMQDRKGIVIVAAMRAGEAGVCEGVVLHVCPVGPTLPYAWHLSWAEVCAVGQTRSEGRPRTVVVKCTRNEPARLAPYDELSSQCFDALPQPRRGDTATPAAGSADTSAVVGTATKVVAAVAVAAIVARCIASSKK